jgi:membrane-associated phospholipid phosphatase
MRLSTRTLVFSSAGCALLFGAILVGVYHTQPGRWLDNAALEGFLSILDSDASRRAAGAVASLCDPVPFAAIGLMLIGVALVRRSARRAAAAAIVLIGSAITTQLLKPALAQVRFDGEVVGFDHIVNPVIDAPAFPSGHATAGMAIALAALIVVPPRLRALTAAAGALLALGVGFAIIALGWHFPSDIVGGYLVATIWCLLTLTALRVADARWPEPGTIRAAARDRAPAALAPVAAITVAAAVGTAIASLDRIAGFAEAHTAATLAALAIATAAAALVGAVSLADRHVR